MLDKVRPPLTETDEERKERHARILAKQRERALANIDMWSARLKDAGGISKYFYDDGPRTSDKRLKDQIEHGTHWSKKP